MGIAAGAAVVSYSVTNMCGSAFAITPFTVLAGTSVGPITGIASVCVGATLILSEGTGGGTWGSSSTTTATVNSSGIVSGIAMGTTTISYSVTSSCGASTATAVIPVIAEPVAGGISGSLSVCEDAAIILTESVAGGTWSSSAPAKATVSTSGLVTGIDTGVAIISYSVVNTCGTATAIHTVSVNMLPFAGTITGADSVCTGAAITLSDTVGAGAWSSSNTRATVSVGVVTGISSGADAIVYTVTNSCGIIDVDIFVHTALGCDSIAGVQVIPRNKESEVYPNPTNSLLTITSSYIINQVTISNILGQCVYGPSYHPLPLLITGGDYQVDVDVSLLEKGIYFVKINGVEVKRFVKELLLT